MLRRIALDFTTEANSKRRMHEVNRNSQSISVGRHISLKP